MGTRNRTQPPALAVLAGIAITSLAPAQSVRLVVDFNLRRGASIDRFLDVGGRACFRVYADEIGSILWSSDGSMGGTYRFDQEIADRASNGLAYQNVWAFGGRVYVHTFYNGGFAQVFEVDPATGHSRVLLDQQMGVGFQSERIAVVWWPFESGRAMGLVRPGTGFDVIPVQGLPDRDVGYAKYTEIDGRWLFVQGRSPWDSGVDRLWRIEESTGQATEVTGLSLPVGDLVTLGGSIVGIQTRNVPYPQRYEETFVWIDPETLASGQLTLPAEFDFGYESLRPIACGNRIYFNALFRDQINPPPRLYWFDGVTHNLGWIGTGVRPDRYSPGVVVIGEDLYYPASTQEVGLELRRYRPGSTAPELIADINPSGDAFVRQSIYDGKPWAMALGHRLVMRADDGSSGIEPWAYDADTGVTRRLLDVMTGSQGSDPIIYGVSGGLLYFTADDGVHGREMWVTDGTPEGTHLVRDIQTGTNGSAPGHFERWGDQLIFSATALPGQDAVYSVPLGQVPATPVRLPFNDGYITRSVRSGNQTYLILHEGGSAGYSFHVGDDSGWHDVPHELRPAWPCSDAGPWQYESMIPCPTGDLFVSNGTDLWITDGSDAGTFPLASGVSPCEWRIIGSRLFFVGDVADSGKELWVSDGTIVGTRVFAELRPGPDGASPRGFVAVGSTLYFVADDAEGVVRLWALDTQANILRIAACPIGSLGLNDPRPFGYVQGRLLIGDTYPFIGNQLIYNWNPVTGEIGHAEPPNFQSGGWSTGSPPFQPLGDRYLGLGVFGGLGEEPASYDPITGETILLADTMPGPAGYVVDVRELVRGVAFFSAFEPGVGSTLWRTDGTPQGTIRVSERAPQANVIGYRSFVIGQHVYVNAADAEHGTELWRIDFCGADYNYDAGVTIDDLLGFLRDFGLGNSDADIVGAGVAGDVPDGVVTIEDLLYFLVHFEAGC